MALVVNDRVKETTTTTGTGTVTLGGAVSGFDTFAAGIGNSNTTYYCIQLGAEFEVGLGTLAGDSSTLARTTVISSSNSDNAVNFSAGAKNVFCTLPASKATVLDASGNLTLAGAVQLNSTFTVGANDQGYDVTLHGDTASRNVVWDSSADSLIFTDNAKAIFGAGSDLQLYHDGSNSYVDDAGTGTLNLRGNDFVIIARSDGSATAATFDTNGPVGLRYNNSTKIETTNTGVDVTGEITTDGLTTSADINFGDNDKALFGAGSDLQIFHDGSNSYIVDSATGNLAIQSSGAEIQLSKGPSGFEHMIRAIVDGAVELYHNNSKKIETTADGISVTGVLTASGIVTANAKLDLNGTELILDADADTSITADTDDQIDFRIGGADKMEMNATAFSGGAIYENADDISANYSITAGKNAFSVGPITIASGVTVTVPSGQRWVIL